MNEIWKDIPGYEGEYQASDLGRIKSLERFVKCGFQSKGRRLVKERILKPGQYVKSGHVSVVLRKGTHGKPVHSLVMLTFKGARPEGLDVCHNDGNPTNNRLDNLRYDTRTNNILDVYKSGGTWRKLNSKQVLEIRALLAEGVSGSEIANRFEVTPTCISGIKLGRSYSWLV